MVLAAKFEFKVSHRIFDTIIDLTRFCEAWHRSGPCCKHCGIGEWMFQQVFGYAKAYGASIIQPSNDERRLRAKKFMSTWDFTRRIKQ